MIIQSYKVLGEVVVFLKNLVLWAQNPWIHIEQRSP